MKPYDQDDDEDWVPGGIYYSVEGNPIDFKGWALERELNKRVDETTVGHIWISTVYLGINHNFGLGPPLIFETMVFERHGDELTNSDLAMRRYATLEEARRGHQEVVAEVMKVEEWGLGIEPELPSD